MDFFEKSFDYVIVGGGTAGLAVAARLSEDPHVQVGVIEAGPSALNGEDAGAITIPGRYGEAIGSKYDWQFETIAQKGLINRSIPWPRGRVLGGTSALNFMAWNRGHYRDYDSWASLGNNGWGFEDLLPHFLQSETFHPPNADHRESFNSFYQADLHGMDGPVQTAHTKEYGLAHQLWYETMEALGIPFCKDGLAGYNYGAWNMLCSIDPITQTRSYAASSYYASAASRPNLHILTNATVLNLVLEDGYSGHVATSARVRYIGNIFEVKAKREIILSAGSVQSPQLLELSGIGRRDVLEAAGIVVMVEHDNVGENLQDHMMFATIYEVLPTLTSRDDIVDDPIRREVADRAYQGSRTGPWTVLPCSVAYCSLSNIISEIESDNLMSDYVYLDEKYGMPYGLEMRRHLGSTKEPEFRGQIEYIFDLGNWSPFFYSEPGKKYATMLQMLQYPFSRGSIHIRARRDEKDEVTIDDKPIIDPRYYLERGQLDKKIMSLTQRFADRICQTEPLAQIIKGRVFPQLPDDPSTEDRLYDAEIMEKYTMTDWHPVGTCAMGGSRGIEAGVVDERLRVYGVRGLRVIDASIMPTQVGAHPQATVYAIAEKGAAMIREDWNSTEN